MSTFIELFEKATSELPQHKALSKIGRQFATRLIEQKTEATCVVYNTHSGKLAFVWLNSNKPLTITMENFHAPLNTVLYLEYNNRTYIVKFEEALSFLRSKLNNDEE